MTGISYFFKWARPRLKPLWRNASHVAAFDQHCSAEISGTPLREI